MGLELTCRVRFEGKESEGIAHCGDGEISFKGDFRFTWKWAELSEAHIRDGFLEVGRRGTTARFELGPLAEKWLQQIKSPKSRIDKLGLKPGHRYAAWGDFDEVFPKELEDRAGPAASSAPFDGVFVRLDLGSDLDVLIKARNQIVENGMIWAVWPKGRKELREDHIRNYALANGLVDVKVASFSETLSALKLVIPVAMRASR